MNNVFLFILFFSLGASAFGQLLNDPVYIQFSSISRSDHSSNDKLSIHYSEWNATTPSMKLTKNMRLNQAIYGRISSIDESNLSSSSSTYPSNLYDLRYSLIFRAKINKNWEMIALPRVLLRSDLSQSVSSQDFFPYLAVMANHAVLGNQNFKIGLGFALNNDFNQNVILPTATLIYNSTKYRVEIVYPNAQFLYKVNKNSEFGIYVNVDGSISRISSEPFSSVEPTYLRSLQLITAPTISHRLIKSYFVHAKIGVSSLRKISYLDRDFNENVQSSANLEPAIFFRIGFSFRIED
jgi:hypothetical protein